MKRPALPIDASAGMRLVVTAGAVLVHLERPDRLPVGVPRRTLCGRPVEHDTAGVVFHDEQCATCWKIAGREAPAP